MKAVDLYWATNPDWFDFADNGSPFLTEDATAEAKESFKRYLEQKKSVNDKAS